MVTSDVRQRLYIALETTHPQQAELVENPSTQVEEYPTPFFQRYKIYSAQRYDYPRLLYVGFAPDLPAYLLPGHPQQFIAMAQADGVNLTTAEHALQYTLTYFEVTRSMSHLFYLISNTAELHFWPEEYMNDDERQHKAAFEHNYGSIITSPRVETLGQDYQVSFYARHKQAVEHHLVTTRSDGNISNTVTILEQNLPLLKR